MKKLFLSALLGASVVLGPAPASAPEEVTIPNTFPAKYALLFMPTDQLQLSYSGYAENAVEQGTIETAEVNWELWKVGFNASGAVSPN